MHLLANGSSRHPGGEESYTVGTFYHGIYSDGNPKHPSSFIRYYLETWLIKKKSSRNVRGGDH